MLNKLIIFYAKKLSFLPTEVFNLQYEDWRTDNKFSRITYTAFPQTCVKFSRGYRNCFSANMCKIQQRLPEQLFRKHVSNSAETRGTPFLKTRAKFTRDYQNCCSENMCQIQQTLWVRLFYKHVSNSAEATDTAFPLARVKFSESALLLLGINLLDHNCLTKRPIVSENRSEKKLQFVYTVVFPFFRKTLLKGQYHKKNA